MYLCVYTLLTVSSGIRIPLFVPQYGNISVFQQPEDSNITVNNGDQMYSQNQQKENSDISQNKADSWFK